MSQSKYRGKASQSRKESWIFYPALLFDKVVRLASLSLNVFLILFCALISDVISAILSARFPVKAQIQLAATRIWQTLKDCCCVLVVAATCMLLYLWDVKLFDKPSRVSTFWLNCTVRVVVWLTPIIKPYSLAVLSAKEYSKWLQSLVYAV